MVSNENFHHVNNKIGIHQKCEGASSHASQAFFYFAFIKKDIG